MKLTTSPKAITTISRELKRVGIGYTKLNNNTLDISSITEHVRSYVRGVLQVA